MVSRIRIRIRSRIRERVSDGRLVILPLDGRRFRMLMMVVVTVARNRILPPGMIVEKFAFVLSRSSSPFRIIGLVGATLRLRVFVVRDELLDGYQDVAVQPIYKLN